MKITVIKVDGTLTSEEREHEPGLAILQETVEGYVELIKGVLYQDPEDGKQHSVFLYVNEDGRLKHLPLNKRATELCGFELVGNIVVVCRGRRSGRVS